MSVPAERRSGSGIGRGVAAAAAAVTVAVLAAGAAAQPGGGHRLAGADPHPAASACSLQHGSDPWCADIK